MKKWRFTEEQIIGVLKEQESGVEAADLCRKRGISEATFYNWKANYGGAEVSEAKRMTALEDENARLRKLIAEQMLDVAALRKLLGKKVGPAAKLEALAHLNVTMGAFGTAGLPRLICRPKDDPLSALPTAGGRVSSGAARSGQ